MIRKFLGHVVAVAIVLGVMWAVLVGGALLMAGAVAVYAHLT